MKLSPAMMRALVKIDGPHSMRPEHFASATLRALVRRALVERYSPDIVDGQPALFEGAHPDHVRLTDKGKPYAVLARLGAKRRKRRR